MRDSDDLAQGIEWVLNQDEEQYSQLCFEARKKVEENYDIKLVSKKHIELYSEII